VGFAPEALDRLAAHAAGGAALRLARDDGLAARYLEAVARTAEYVNHLT
jgi:hypothetical protein